MSIFIVICWHHIVEIWRNRGNRGLSFGHLQLGELTVNIDYETRDAEKVDLHVIR